MTLSFSLLVGVCIRSISALSGSHRNQLMHEMVGWPKRIMPNPNEPTRVCLCVCGYVHFSTIFFRCCSVLGLCHLRHTYFPPPPPTSESVGHTWQTYNRTHDRGLLHTIDGLLISLLLSCPAYTPGWWWLGSIGDPVARKTAQRTTPRLRVEDGSVVLG